MKTILFDFFLLNAFSCCSHSFQGFYDANGKRTDLFYQVAMGRLAFFIAFEHVVFFIKVIAMALIPDIPKGE